MRERVRESEIERERVRDSETQREQEEQEDEEEEEKKKKKKRYLKKYVVTRTGVGTEIRTRYLPACRSPTPCDKPQRLRRPHQWYLS